MKTQTYSLRSLVLALMVFFCFVPWINAEDEIHQKDVHIKRKTDRTLEVWNGSKEYTATVLVRYTTIDGLDHLKEYVRLSTEPQIITEKQKIVKFKFEKEPKLEGTGPTEPLNGYVPGKNGPGKK